LNRAEFGNGKGERGHELLVRVNGVLRDFFFE
jgi:hypothetical protein